MVGKALLDALTDAALLRRPPCCLSLSCPARLLLLQKGGDAENISHSAPAPAAVAHCPPECGTHLIWMPRRACAASFPRVAHTAPPVCLRLWPTLPNTPAAHTCLLSPLHCPIPCTIPSHKPAAHTRPLPPLAASFSTPVRPRRAHHASLPCMVLGCRGGPHVHSSVLLPLPGAL